MARADASPPGDSTIVSRGGGDSGDADHRAEQLVLAIAWCRAEGARAGEVIATFGGTRGRVFEFGRGEGDGAQGAAQRATLVRMRPGGATQCEPLGVRGLSRRQLLLRHRQGAELRAENVGKAELKVDGRVCDHATLREGSVVEIGSHLALLAVVRPPELPPLRDFPSDAYGEFGEADADGFVGESLAAWSLRDRVAFIAARAAHVLVTGESGVGKELVARALHRLSPRAAAPLVSRNAATLPEGLVDAELFGNVKDYPNPGMPERPGLIGEADGGSLFLDEIGELPTAMQAHLLRVLDDGELHRLGDANARRSDFRLIAATNRDPASLKHDFAARLKLRLVVPPLATRREDIPLVARRLLVRIAQEDDRIARRFFELDAAQPNPRVAVDLMVALCRHEYSLHVRELEGLLWRSLSTSPGDELALTDEVRAELGTTPPQTEGESPPARPEDLDPQHIQDVLDAHEGVQEKAWRALRLKNRYALIRLIKKHGLQVRRDG